MSRYSISVVVYDPILRQGVYLQFPETPSSLVQKSVRLELACEYATKRKPSARIVLFRRLVTCVLSHVFREMIRESL